MPNKMPSSLSTRRSTIHSKSGSSHPQAKWTQRSWTGLSTPRDLRQILHSKTEAGGKRHHIYTQMIRVGESLSLSLKNWYHKFVIQTNSAHSSAPTLSNRHPFLA